MSVEIENKKREKILKGFCGIHGDKNGKRSGGKRANLIRGLCGFYSNGREEIANFFDGIKYLTHEELYIRRCESNWDTSWRGPVSYLEY